MDFQGIFENLRFPIDDNSKFFVSHSNFFYYVYNKSYALDSITKKSKKCD